MIESTGQNLQSTREQKVGRAFFFDGCEMTSRLRKPIQSVHPDHLYAIDLPYAQPIRAIYYENEYLERKRAYGRANEAKCEEK